MIEWRIVMSLNGVNKKTDLSFRAKGLRHAKQRVFQEVRVNLPGKKRLDLQARGAGAYTIVSGRDAVGDVVLKHDNN